MAARSLNKVELIGNLTKDPELRYTPQGTAVASFRIATNRVWTTETGEKRDEADFHQVVAWNKLAELCSQLLSKGSKVFVEGRLANRNWTGQDGVSRRTTEIVISDMILLGGGRRVGEEEETDYNDEGDSVEEEKAEKKESNTDKVAKKEKEEPRKSSSKKEKKSEKSNEDEVNPDDIPF